LEQFQKVFRNYSANIESLGNVVVVTESLSSPSTCKAMNQSAKLNDDIPCFERVATLTSFGEDVQSLRHPGLHRAEDRI
jgi:hypothetical protein